MININHFTGIDPDNSGYDEDLKMLKQGMVQQDGIPYEPHATLIMNINKKVQKSNPFVRHSHLCKNYIFYVHDFSSSCYHLAKTI